MYRPILVVHVVSAAAACLCTFNNTRFWRVTTSIGKHDAILSYTSPFIHFSPLSFALLRKYVKWDIIQENMILTIIILIERLFWLNSSQGSYIRFFFTLMYCVILRWFIGNVRKVRFLSLQIIWPCTIISFLLCLSQFYLLLQFF